MVRNSVRDKDAICTPNDFRRDVVANRQNEHEDRARSNSRHRLWKIHTPERGPVCRSQALGGTQITWRNGLHDRIERQDHERQQDMRHRNHSPRCIVHKN